MKWGNCLTPHNRVCSVAVKKRDTEWSRGRMLKADVVTLGHEPMQASLKSGVSTLKRQWCFVKAMRPRGVTQFWGGRECLCRTDYIVLILQKGKARGAGGDGDGRSLVWLSYWCPGHLPQDDCLRHSELEEGESGPAQEVSCSKLVLLFCSSGECGECGECGELWATAALLQKISHNVRGPASS